MFPSFTLSFFFFFLDNCNGLGATSFFIFIIDHFSFYFQLHSVMVPTFSISINLLDLLVKSELNFCFYMWDLLIDQHPCILYNCPLLVLHMGPSDFFFIYRWVKKSWEEKANQTAVVKSWIIASHLRGQIESNQQSFEGLNRIANRRILPIFLNKNGKF